jgi:cell division protein FtsW (lipid II flippase)
MTESIQPIDWAAPGANLGSTLLFTLLLLSPFLWGAAVWHWLLAVAIGLVLGVYFSIRRERFEEPGPDAEETRFPR